MKREPVGAGPGVSGGISEAVASMVMMPRPPRAKARFWAVTRKRCRPTDIPGPRANGFTLLEIMVSVAILSISLVALLSFQGNTMITSGRAEKMTEAAMLARMRMAEIELDLESLQKKGEFPEEKTEEGEFGEPFGGYRWKMAIRNVKLPAPVQGDEGSIEGMVGRQLTEEIAKTVREVRLDVIWEEMGQEQSINVVTHIVKL